ncbi:F0F1 ATP synthase subunit A [Flavobacteriales bacterium]|nr:F0F1 ATP synthase subunit A [Flavobacteriales bacterium]
MKIKNHILKSALISLLALVSTTNIFAENHSEEKTEQKTYNPVPKIMHHIQNSHEWHLFDYKDSKGKLHPVSIPLPVILYTNGNLDFFMSSDFNHGHSEVQKEDRIYSIDSHGHIIEQKGMSIFDISITKNVASMLISVLLILFLLMSTANGYKKNKYAPKKIQAFLEPLILFVRDDIIKANIGPKHERYTSFLLTVFFFILINNYMGLLPGAANVTGNISVTLVLSVFTFIITTISANKNYWKHIFNPPTPLVLMPIMVPIEVFGVFTKPFALMVRLFANITAGHITILSLISLIFIAQSGSGNGAAWGVAPLSVLFVLFIYLIELLVAFLQAYIFTLLSAVFIGLAVKEDH